MAEPFRGDARVDTGGHHQRCSRVARGMEGEPLASGSFERSPPGPLEGYERERTAMLVGEDEVALIPLVCA